jgi:bifunctional DNA-binding transcriptional regulator/antitoxin component of YhaV-PrlF toxin-antitoxin module
MAMPRLRISKRGRISVPAAIRRRWDGRRIALEDRGDHVVLRPAPDDPAEAARRALKDLAGRVTSKAMRREARAAESSSRSVTAVPRDHGPRLRPRTMPTVSTVALNHIRPGRSGRSPISQIHQRLPEVALFH